MRGDRPSDTPQAQEAAMFTPHARGSTSNIGFGLCEASVYPACAGIDHYITFGHVEKISLPRMRGDRPGSACVCGYKRRFTPHARGSTPDGPRCPGALCVYPACAGIDQALVV